MLLVEARRRTRLLVGHELGRVHSTGNNRDSIIIDGIGVCPESKVSLAGIFAETTPTDKEENSDYIEKYKYT